MKSATIKFLFGLCLGLTLSQDLAAYARSICDSGGSGRVHFHVHVGYRYDRRGDEMLMLFMLSSTSTTTYCLSIADEEQDRYRSARSERRRYSYLNYEAIREDVARGGGEHLNTLARLLGCPTERIPGVAQLTQKNYRLLFRETSEEAAEQLIPRIGELVGQDPDLKEACRSIPDSSATL